MRLALLSLCAAVFCFGMVRYSTWVAIPEGQALREFCRNGATDVTIRGQISSIPVAHRKPESVYAPRLYGPPHQTRFNLTPHQVSVNERITPVSGVCRVYVQGRGAESFSSGDIVSLNGRLDWPLPPGNPGEFDFSRFLKRQNTAGMLFVDQTSDINVLQPTGRFAPLRLLGIVRNEAYRILAANIASDVRGIAMALLLGSRHELAPEISHSFVASGTMHLLAISGLHVGILCLFMLRIQHVLMVNRRFALLFTLSVCICYALMTDLRSSVLRATIFFMVFVIGELFNRQQRMPGLLSLTALLMMLYQPGIVFETGAWLSFLSVAALGWEASRQKVDNIDRPAPLDGVTLGDKVRRWTVIFARRLRLRYRQMLYILIFTTPLVASTFHVLSPIGLIVNIALIPLTGIALCVGFLTLCCGLLLPQAAAIPGLIFSGILIGLVTIVSATASIDRGHFFVADFPAWFLPAYYSILLAALILRTSVWQRATFGMLLVMWVVVLIIPPEQRVRSGIECTILDVGHGNATVIECANGDVFLIDAGGRNRSDRTADIVCRFLWNRGHERLTGILISHPDADHFNGLPGILTRLPVAQMMVSTDFHNSDNMAVLALRDLISTHQIPVRTVVSGDSIKAGDANLVIQQMGAETDEDQPNQNERSLVVCIKHRDHRILLPADLEGHGVQSLLPQIGPATVLVAPAHGAKKANTRLVASAVQPKYVVASAANDANRAYLENIYSSSSLVRFTSRAGAVSIRLREGQEPLVSSHR